MHSPTEIHEDQQDHPKPANDPIHRAVEHYVSNSVSPPTGELTGHFAKDIYTHTLEAIKNPESISSLRDPYNLIVRDILATLPAEIIQNNTHPSDQTAPGKTPDQPALPTDPSTLSESHQSPSPQKLRRTTRTRLSETIKRGLNRLGFPVFLGLAGLTGITTAYLDKKDATTLLPDPLPDAIENDAELNPELHAQDQFLRNLALLTTSFSKMIEICADSLPDDYPIKKHLKSFKRQEVENFLNSIYIHYYQRVALNPQAPNALQKLLMNNLPRIAVAKLSKADGLAFQGANLIVLNASIDSADRLLHVLTHEFLHSEIQFSGNLLRRTFQNAEGIKGSRVPLEGATELKARQMTEIRFGVYEKLTYRAFLLELFNAEKLNELYSGLGDQEKAAGELRKSFDDMLGISKVEVLEEMWERFLQGEDNLEVFFANAMGSALNQALLNATEKIQERGEITITHGRKMIENRRMTLITAILAMHKDIDVHESLSYMFGIPPYGTTKQLIPEEDSKIFPKAFIDAVAEAKDQYTSTGRIEQLPDYFKQYLEPLSPEEIARMESMDMEAMGIAANLPSDPLGITGEFSSATWEFTKKSMDIILALLLTFFTLKKIRRREKFSTDLLAEETILQIASISDNRRFSQAFYHSQLSPRTTKKNPTPLVEDLQIIETLFGELQDKTSTKVLNKTLSYSVIIGAIVYISYFGLYKLTGFALTAATLQSLRWFYGREYGHMAMGNFNEAAAKLRELGRNIPGFQSTEAIHTAATPHQSDPKPLLFQIFESDPKHKDLKAIKYHEIHPGTFVVTSTDTTTGETVKTTIALDEEDHARVKLEESACTEKPDRFAHLKIDVELMENEKIDGYFEFSNNLYLIKIKQNDKDEPIFGVTPGPFYEGEIDPKFFHINRYVLKEFDMVKFEFVFKDKTTGETTRIREKKPRETSLGSQKLLSARKNGKILGNEDLSHLIREIEANDASAPKAPPSTSEMEFRREEDGFSYTPRTTLWESTAHTVSFSTNPTAISHGITNKPQKVYQIGRIYILCFTPEYTAVTFDDSTNIKQYLQNSPSTLCFTQATDGTPLVSQAGYPESHIEKTDPLLIDPFLKRGISDLFRPVHAGRGEYPEKLHSNPGTEKIIAGLCKSFGLQLSAVAEETRDETPLRGEENGAILARLAAKLPGQVLIEEASENLRKKNADNQSDPFNRPKKAEHPEPKQRNAHGPETVNGRHIKDPDIGDFDTHAHYHPGDDPRHLDWRASAKSTHPLVKRYRHSRETEFPKRNLIASVSSLLEEATYRKLFDTLFETLHDKKQKKFKSIILAVAESGYYEIIDLEKLTINNLAEVFDAIIARSKKILDNNSGKTETHEIRISRIKRNRKKHGRQELSDEKLEEMVSMRTRLDIQKITLKELRIPHQLKTNATGIGFTSRVRNF